LNRPSRHIERQGGQNDLLARELCPVAAYRIFLTILALVAVHFFYFVQFVKLSSVHSSFVSDGQELRHPSSLAKNARDRILFGKRNNRSGQRLRVPWRGEAVWISPCLLTNTGWVKVPVQFLALAVVALFSGRSSFVIKPSPKRLKLAFACSAYGSQAFGTKRRTTRAPRAQSRRPQY
jgi:hypothetical protein